jgi:hypothetical protein
VSDSPVHLDLVQVQTRKGRADVSVENNPSAPERADELDHLLYPEPIVRGENRADGGPDAGIGGPADVGHGL